MPHYCRICGRDRPNEKFSGRGHRDHLLILEIARVKPHKRRRWKFLAHKHFDLYVRLKELWGDECSRRCSRFSRLSRFGCALLIAWTLAQTRFPLCAQGAEERHSTMSS